MSAKQLQGVEAVLKRELKGTKRLKIWLRTPTMIPVCTKGNEVRMGKGKGGFDYWAVRIPIGRIIFEVDGDDLREEVAKAALRHGMMRLPGSHAFVSRAVDNSPWLGFRKLVEA